MCCLTCANWLCLTGETSIFNIDRVFLDVTLNTHAFFFFHRSVSALNAVYFDRQLYWRLASAVALMLLSKSAGTFVS
jgi:hypothetical protein